MEIIFYKYQGTGNDFVVLDNRNKIYDVLKTEQVRFLCDRRFGIGADGLMFLNDSEEYDFEMKYFNADGKEGTMCGNGGRCLVQFAYDSGIIKSDYTFIAIDGVHEASMETDGLVSLKMTDVDKVHTVHGNFVLNTGSPHFIELTSNVDEINVVKKGREIRNSKPYKEEGINVNFVQQLEDRDNIIVRTYERGVEDETFSCGTGVTAAAIVCYHNDNGFNSVEVKTRGGNLSVEYDKIGETFRNIWLTGPAVKVFEGKIVLNKSID